MNALKERIEILRESDQITELTEQKLSEYIEGFDIRFNYSLTEDNASALITHLAIAMSRIQSGNIVNPLDDCIVNDLKSNPKLDEVEILYADLCQRVDVEFPEAEKWFIMAHLSVLNEKMK